MNLPRPARALIFPCTWTGHTSNMNGIRGSPGIIIGVLDSPTSPLFSPLM